MHLFNKQKVTLTNHTSSNLVVLHLEVSALGFEPVLDVALWISGEAEHEVPLDLQLVDGLDGLMDLEDEQSEEKFCSGRTKSGEFIS